MLHLGSANTRYSMAVEDNLLSGGNSINDDGGPPATVASQVSTPSAQAQPPLPASSPPAATTGQLGGEQAGSQGEWTGIRDALRSQGINLPDGLDDQAIVRQLGQSYQQAQQYQNQVRQLEQYAQYGQAIMPHWDKFQGWLQEQNSAAQAKQQKDAQAPWYSKWHNPPEYNQAWDRLIERDPVTGQLRVVPGADPTILPKYTQYQAYQRQTAEKLLANPYQFFEEPIRHIAQEVAEKIAKQNLTSYQDNLFSDNFVQQNASWLVQKDQSGRAVSLTPEGQAFRGFVLEAEQMGVKDVRAQQHYATRMLERELALQNLQKNGNAQTGDDKKQAYLNQAAGANHVPGQSGSIQIKNGSATTQNPSLTLPERLRQAFESSGITDKNLQLA